jgi:hypothetical protein
MPAQSETGSAHQTGSDPNVTGSSAEMQNLENMLGIVKVETINNTGGLRFL